MIEETSSLPMRRVETLRIPERTVASAIIELQRGMARRYRAAQAAYREGDLHYVKVLQSIDYTESRRLQRHMKTLVDWGDGGFVENIDASADICAYPDLECTISPRGFWHGYCGNIAASVISILGRFF